MASVSDDFSPPRVPLETDVECLSDVVVGTMRFPTLNVGQGGLFIKTAMPMNVGTLIHCTFCLPDGYDLSVEGEVAWSRKGPLTQIPPPGMGVRFTSIPLEDLDHLQEYVDQFEEEGAEPQIEVSVLDAQDVIALPLPPPPDTPVAPSPEALFDQSVSGRLPEPPMPNRLPDPPAPHEVVAGSESVEIASMEPMDATPVRPAPPVPPAPLSGVSVHPSSSAPRAPMPPAPPEVDRSPQPLRPPSQSVYEFEGDPADDVAPLGNELVGGEAELLLEPWGLSFDVRVVGLDPPTLALNGTSPVGYLVGPDGRRAEVSLSSISFDRHEFHEAAVVRLASWHGADDGEVGMDVEGSAGFEGEDVDRVVAAVQDAETATAGVPMRPHDVAEDSAVGEWEQRNEMSAVEPADSGFDAESILAPAVMEQNREHGSASQAASNRPSSHRTNRLKGGRKAMSRVAITVVSCLVLVGVGAVFAIVVGSKKARRRHNKNVPAQVKTASGAEQQPGNVGAKGLDEPSLPGRAPAREAGNLAGSRRIADRPSSSVGRHGNATPVRQTATTRRVARLGTRDRRSGEHFASTRTARPVDARSKARPSKRRVTHGAASGRVVVTKGPLPIRRQSGKAKMALAAKGRPAKLSHYWLANPPGVVVDMGGVRASLKPGKYVFKDADVRFVRVLKRGRGVRFIVYFKSKAAASSSTVMAGSKGGQLIWRTTGPTQVSMR